MLWLKYKETILNKSELYAAKMSENDKEITLQNNTVIHFFSLHMSEFCQNRCHCTPFPEFLPRTENVHMCSLIVKFRPNAFIKKYSV